MANIGILIAMVSFLPETYAQICTVPELSQCICLHGGTEVDCRGIGLTEIPRNIPNTTKALYLDRNAITIIDSASLFGLTSLELLSLTGNTITSIETGAFDWLWSLTYLSLQGDTELDIPGEVLTAINSFTNLSSLSLINCRISSEDINLLSGLQSLKTLSLPNNDISYIKAGFFNGFSSLVNLQLWGNNLTTVSANIFNTTTNISLLVLADNPLLCCTMTDFFEWRPNQPKLRNLYGTCNDFNRTTDINLFNTSHCTFPVDGQWGSWSTPTCSVTCGVGTGLRNRSCDSPPPSDNGKECVGPNMEAINCSLEVCPVDGQWGSWSTQSCSVTCGDGIRSRNRSCDSPPPSDNGQECVGSSMETMNCNLKDCTEPYRKFYKRKGCKRGNRRGRK